MKPGRLVGIYLAPEPKQSLSRVTKVEAVAHRGLRGDRYFEGAGTFSQSVPRGPGREITLIESEVIATVNQSGIPLTPEESRRNLITEGVRLNDLVGKTFLVGPVLLEGIRLCHPCGHLDQLTGKPLKSALENQGGLRANILTDGIIEIGNPILVAPLPL